MKQDKDFLITYYNQLSNHLNSSLNISEDLISIKKAILEADKVNKKVMIFGNGGSASIASHFTVDLTKMAKKRCVNLNEANFITCFANDYGYENWVARAIDFYADEGDVLILISSSGRSENMLNAVDAGRAKKISSIITLSGFDDKNPLRSKGDINLWLDSHSYNYVENIHQIWLLSVVDMIIGKIEYPNTV
ncbi:MAG: SIS domain-containing protein [Rickettsiales bacterium]|nr:SIS domain-containing protein [Rickettsiales bacterium]